MTDKQLDQWCKKFKNYECENQMTIDEYLQALEDKQETNDIKGAENDDIQL